MQHVSEISQARQIIESTIFAIMERGADHTDRQGMNFKYISSDWIGTPGWFFWPRGKRGVFLVKEQRFEKLYKNKASADFALYYYPHPEEAVFTDYSFAEQVTRVSELFSREGVAFFSGCCEHGHDNCNEERFQDLQEGKGIPTPAARERLSETLFRIGSITLVANNDTLSQAIVQAPIRSRTWSIVDIPCFNSSELLLNAGEIDRNVPCWELADFFITGLINDIGLTAGSCCQEGGANIDEVSRCVYDLHY
jgi:hypothetical protein